jgi:general stress protein 26
MTSDSTLDETRTLGQALDGLKFAMVGTGPSWECRPLTLSGHEDDLLHFLVSASAEWVQELPALNAPATATFSDPARNIYVGLKGAARLSREPELIDRVWNAEAAGFFDGKDDPELRVLTIVIASGQWWDSPGGALGHLLALARAVVDQEPSHEGAVIP